VRTSKRRVEPEETDDEINPEIWSEDESTNHHIKNQNLTKPKLGEHIRAWNTFGEEFSGEVTQYWSQRPNQFKIKEHGTSAKLWVDLKNLNLWEYIEKPSSDSEDDNLGYPSLYLLNAGTTDTEEYAYYAICYLIRNTSESFYADNG